MIFPLFIFQKGFAELFSLFYGTIVISTSKTIVTFQFIKHNRLISLDLNDISEYFRAHI